MVRFAPLLAERMSVPDNIIRAGMRAYIARLERRPAVSDATFVESMTGRPIAEHTADANSQHYELPAAFFENFLGPRRKYSCALFPTGQETLAQAEELALDETAAHADLREGQTILELGCGWGALTLFMAERFPGARITAVSNSQSQRLYIEAQCRKRGLSNVDVLTADMNEFITGLTFDRVVSVEMFEHMSNWRPLLSRTKQWLNPGGSLFIHVFTHRFRPSRYELTDEDWITKHFFAGGIMPSPGLIRAFADILAVQKEWRWSGVHYRHTAERWLQNFDANREAIDPILLEVYGADVGLWRRRWRMFLLATAESFGHADGEVWGVNHYRLARAS